MSIGERRKKIGAIVALVVPAAAGVFKAVGPSAFYWGIGLFAASLAIYSNFAFREQADGPETDQATTEAPSASANLATVR